MLLGHERFHAAEVLPIAHQYDFSAHVYLQLLEFLKVLRRTVICVDHLRFDIARRRHRVVRHHYPRITLKTIILKRISVQVLVRRPVHLQALRSGHIHADFRGIVKPHAVLDNFCIQASLAKFAGHVVGRGFVFRRSCDMGRLRQSAQVLLGQLGIGHCEVSRFQVHLGGRIPKTEDCRRGICGLGGTLSGSTGTTGATKKKS